MFEDKTLNSKYFCRSAAYCLLVIGRLISDTFNVSKITFFCPKQNGSSLLAKTHFSLQAKNVVYLFQTAASRGVNKAAELSKKCGILTEIFGSLFPQVTFWGM